MGTEDSHTPSARFQKTTRGPWDKMAAAAGDAGSFKYMTGFGNEFQTEALAGALPARGNTPQVRALHSHSTTAHRLLSPILCLLSRWTLTLPLPLLHIRDCRKWRMDCTQSSCRGHLSPHRAAKTSGGKPPILSCRPRAAPPWKVNSAQMRLRATRVDTRFLALHLPRRGGPAAGSTGTSNMSQWRWANGSARACPAPQPSCATRHGLHSLAYSARETRTVASRRQQQYL